VLQAHFVAISPDSRRAFVADVATVRAVDLETGSEPTRVPLDHHVDDHHVDRLAVAPGGAHVAAVDGNLSLALWPRGPGAPAFHAEAEARAVAFDAKGERLLAATETGALVWYDVASGARKESRSLDAAPWKSAAITPDLRRVATGYDVAMSSLKLWNVDSGEVVWTGTAPQGFEELAIDASARYVVARESSDHFRLYDTKAGSEGKPIGREGGKASCCTVRGTIGFLGWDDPEETKYERVECWDLARVNKLWHLDTPGKHVYAVTCSPEGDVLAVGDLDRVLLLDPATGKELDAIQLASEDDGDDPTSVAFVDARHLVVGTGRGLLLTFELAGGR
jgi:WD40 repeat protein